MDIADVTAERMRGRIVHLEEELAELQLELREVMGERDILLRGLRSAYGFAQRKVLCRCKQVLSDTIVAAAAFTAVDDKQLRKE